MLELTMCESYDSDINFDDSRSDTDREEELPWEKWTIMKIGICNSVQHRICFLAPEGHEVSPMNEIPLYSREHLNYMCTTPKNSKAVYEFETSEDVPSLRHPASHGKAKVLTKPSKWNIGYLPQTWTDPSTILKGDFKNLVFNGQPLELVEISKQQAKFGEVRDIKPVAAFSVTHGSVLSWHIIAINVDDYDSEMSSMKELIGEICEIREWLKTCFCGQDFENMRSIGYEECLFSFKRIEDIVVKAHSTWSLYSQAQGERQERTELFNYGHNVWANYVSHEGSRIFPEPKPNQHKLSGLLWEEAHVCEERTNLELGSDPGPAIQRIPKLAWSSGWRKSISGPEIFFLFKKAGIPGGSPKSFSSINFSPRDMSPDLSPSACDKLRDAANRHVDKNEKGLRTIEGVVKRWALACLYSETMDDDARQ